MITLESTRKDFKITDYSIFQTIYHQFLNDNFYDTSLQVLVLTIVVFITLYNLTNLICLVFLYIWFSSLTHRHRECCNNIDRIIECLDVSRSCGERKGRAIRVLRARSCENFNSRKRSFMKSISLRKHLIRYRRYFSLHLNCQTLADSSLFDCLSDAVNCSLINLSSSPLFDYRNKKSYYLAFDNDIIRTPARTREKDRKHFKHSTKKLKHRTVQNQLNREKTLFNSITFDKNSTVNDFFINSFKKPFIILNKSFMPSTNDQSSKTFDDDDFSNSFLNNDIYALMTRLNFAKALFFDEIDVSEFLRR